MWFFAANAVATTADWVALVASAVTLRAVSVAISSPSSVTAFDRLRFLAICAVTRSCASAAALVNPSFALGPVSSLRAAADNTSCAAALFLAAAASPSRASLASYAVLSSAW